MLSVGSSYCCNTVVVVGGLLVGFVAGRLVVVICYGINGKNDDFILSVLT